MKKVRFSNIVTIYEIDNSSEHQSARDGLQDFRDRQRFQRRIKNVELILNCILEDKIKKYLFDILPYACIF